MIAGLIASLARLVSGASIFFLSGPPDERQRVYFANHTSHLDFVVLWSALPARARERTRPVAARDYWGRGALRRYFSEKVFRAVLIERGRGSVTAARTTIEQLVAEMGDRSSLIVFPEGTRGSGEEVAPFKSGLYHLCRQKSEVELLPVYLDNLNRILPKGEMLPVPMLSRVVFGRPMYLESDETKPRFLERARDAVRALQDL